MIQVNITSERGEQLDVTLYSNKWEFELSVGTHFLETIYLNKSQVSELIVGLVEMHKEMID